MFKKTIFLASTILCLSGCLGYKGYKIEFANSNIITVNSDPTFANMSDLEQVAQEHCSKYGEDAGAAQAIDTSEWDLKTMTFPCIPRKDHSHP